MAIFEEVSGESLPGDIALSRMTTELYHTLVLLNKYEANPGEHIRREMEKTLSSLDAHKTMHDLFHQDDELTAQIEQFVQEFSRSVTQYVLLLQKGAGKEHGEVVRLKIDTLLERFVSSINPNIEKGFETSYRNISDVQEMNLQFRRILLISSGVILFLALLLSLFIADLFSKPLRALRDAAKQIGAGHLDFTLPVTSQDEIGDLAQAFNNMGKNLATMRAEEKRLEQALRRTQKMDAIGQLTGGIAHDFNNILSIMLGNLDILQRLVSADDSALKRVETMRKAGQRAADLTKQLLIFSRDHAAETSVTDINQVIKEMGSLITRSVTPEVEVVNHFAIDLWNTEIDAGDFEDSLLNLIINARDSMVGHGHLTIETHNTTLDAAYCEQHPGISPGEYVGLSVSDDGKGIPYDQQERIFEPFYTTKDKGKGTGLGLAMVFGFVKRSGGYIECCSEEGAGTTFRLYLPRAKGEAQQNKQNGEQAKTLPRGTETILVVDDENDLADLARESLEAQGYRVLTASNGMQALKLLAEEPVIDLLFSDIVMPGGINGYELAKQARTIQPKIKVQLTSGYTANVTEQNIDKTFDTKLLAKPYTQADMVHRVRAILDG